MEPAAIATATLGLLIVVARAPLVLAPRTALRVFHRVLASTRACRAIGAGIGAIGVGLAVTAPAIRTGHPTASAGLVPLGWILVVLGGGVLLSPRRYAAVAESLLGSTSDDATLRVLGAFGTAAGGLFLWLAWEIR